MSGATTELNLATAVDSDDNADYLTLSLANSLRTVDGLFNNVTGHTHGGAHQGGPVSSIPATAIPDGSITSAKILDGTIATADLANAAVTNAKLGPDTARANLLVNGGFEVWQRGVGAFLTHAAYTADRWVINLSGTDTLSVSRGTTGNTDIGSLYCAGCVFGLGSGAGNTALQQQFKISDNAQLAGRSITASLRVKTSTLASVRLALVSDGTGGTTALSALNATNNVYETLTATLAIPVDATGVYLQVRFSAACTAYLDNAMLVIGSQYADYQVPHPADDLARCQRYFEILGETSGEMARTFNSTGAAQIDDATFSYHVRKTVVPTTTKNGTWTIANTGQPVLAGSGVNSLIARTTTTAAGTASYNNGAAGSNFSVESNP